MILSVGGFFSRIGRGFKAGGKVAWRVYNSGPGKVLITAFAPAKIAHIVATSVGAVNEIGGYMKEESKRSKAKEIVLAKFPQAAEDKKLLNFLVEAQLLKLAGNADIS